MPLVGDFLSHNGPRSSLRIDQTFVGIFLKAKIASERSRKCRIPCACGLTPERKPIMETKVMERSIQIMLKHSAKSSPQGQRREALSYIGDETPALVSHSPSQCSFRHTVNFGLK